MKTFLTVAAVLLGLIGALFLLPLLFHGKDDSGEPSHGLPWQIDTLYGGKSRVFDLILGESTLEDAKRKLGGDLQVALIAAPGETGAVEAYFERINSGFITGKMIVTAEIADDVLLKMRERSIKKHYMESSTRKITLAAEDLQLAMAAPIRALSFIPSINLNAGMVEQRFGTPTERIRIGSTEHLLYPEKGLDAVLDSDGKEVLQYVAPGRFGQLKDPLLIKRK